MDLEMLSQCDIPRNNTTESCCTLFIRYCSQYADVFVVGEFSVSVHGGRLCIIAFPCLVL